MIKLEHVVLASPEQMEFIIEGMRNPMNSWEKKDSREGCEQGLCWKTCKFSPHWWKEFDTYKVGTVANSCSTMHKIQEKEFTLEDFSIEHLAPQTRQVLEITIEDLNDSRSIYLKTKNKGDWWQMIQLLPSSYNQTRNVMMNYEVLENIYDSRKNHKLDEWREFCKWIETLPYSELITGGAE